MINVIINIIKINPKFMEQNPPPQQLNARSHHPILVTIGSILITAVLVGFGMYFLTSKLTTTNNLSSQDVSERESAEAVNNIYVLSSTIISAQPLETLSLVFDSQKVFLIRNAKNGEIKIELKLIGDYIRRIFKNRETPSETYEPEDPKIFLSDSDEVTLIEIEEKIVPDAVFISRTVFAINNNTKAEQKLYLLETNPPGGGSIGGGSSMTLFDKHDLIFDCDETEVDPGALSRRINFLGCNEIYLIENYSKKEGVYHQNEGVKIPEEVLAEAREKHIGSIYYDKNNKIIEPKTLGDKQGQEALLYIGKPKDLILGKVKILLNGGTPSYKYIDLQLTVD